jgi:hypothetical protein
MNSEQRLKMVKVEVLYRRDNQVVVIGALNNGDKLILNDILPAIEGMLLRETGDEAVTDEIVIEEMQENAS